MATTCVDRFCEERRRVQRGRGNVYAQTWRRAWPYRRRDAELVMLGSEGRPQFAELVRRSRMRKLQSIRAASRWGPAAIFAFDLLELRGWDTRRLPRLECKALLQKTLDGAKRIRYVEQVANGLGLFTAAEEAGLEGIVAKKGRAPYRWGRTGNWIKLKTTAGRALVEDRGKWNDK